MSAADDAVSNVRAMAERAIAEKVGGPLGGRAVVLKVRVAEQQCVEDLCANVPANEVFSLNRETVVRLIRMAFNSGSLHTAEFLERSDV